VLQILDNCKIFVANIRVTFIIAAPWLCSQFKLADITILLIERIPHLAARTIVVLCIIYYDHFLLRNEILSI
jgi:hypothetical protein